MRKIFGLKKFECRSSRKSSNFLPKCGVGGERRDHNIVAIVAVKVTFWFDPRDDFHVAVTSVQLPGTGGDCKATGREKDTIREREGIGSTT